MKLTPKKIIVIGIIMVILGMAIGITAFNVIIKNPKEEAVKTLYYSSGSGEDYTYNISRHSQVVNLKKGEYDIWYEEGFLWLGTPNSVTITDMNDEIIYSKDTLTGSSDRIEKDGEDYRRYGTFEITSSGDYIVTVSTDCTLYITPPIDVGFGLALGFGFIVIGIIGVIIVFVGIALYFFQKKETSKSKAPPQPAYTQYSPYPYYAPPAQPSPAQPPASPPPAPQSAKATKQDAQTPAAPAQPQAQPPQPPPSYPYPYYPNYSHYYNYPYYRQPP
jgi:uncharacterized membrane protein